MYRDAAVAVDFRRFFVPISSGHASILKGFVTEIRRVENWLAVESKLSDIIWS
jgi:hypothetical protein